MLVLNNMVSEQSVPEVPHTEAAMTEEEERRCMAMLDNLLAVTKKLLGDLTGLAHKMTELEATLQPLVASIRASPPSGTAPTSTSITAMGHAMVATTPSAEANPTANMPAKCSTVCLDQDTSTHTSAFTPATTPSTPPTITELDVTPIRVVAAQSVIDAFTTDNVLVTPTKCSTEGSSHVTITDGRVLAHPSVDKLPSVPSLRSVVVTKLDTEVAANCLTEGPRLDADDIGATDLAIVLSAGPEGMLLGFAINNGPTSVLDNVFLRACSCGCYHVVLSTTSSTLLGASYIIPNIIQAAPTSVPQGHLATRVILTLTSKGDELSHLRILYLPNDHKGFEEMSDGSTMVRWPSPREWVKRQPWPPPAQVIIAGNKAKPRPAPWPSFKCCYREVQLQATNKEGNSANSDAQGGKYSRLCQVDISYVMVVELNQGAVIVGVDKFCEECIGAVELQPRRLPPMPTNSRCVVVVRWLLKHMVEWSRRLVEIKWWPPPTHKKIMRSRGVVEILLPPALVAITSNGSEKSLANMACELQPKPWVLFMRSPSDGQERLKSSRSSPIHESTVCRVVNLLVLMVSEGYGNISSSWSCGPVMEVAVPVVCSKYSHVEQLKYGEGMQDTVHEYCSSVNFLDGNNCSPWESLCISDQLHGKSGNSTEEIPVKKVYKLFLVMLHVEIKNPEHVLCSSTQLIISGFIDCKSCRVSVGTLSSKVAIHFMERHTKMDQKLHEVSNYDQLLQLSHVLCGQKGCLDPENFKEFKLAEKRQLSHNVAKFKFALATPTYVLGFPIGQHTSCRGQDAAGEEVIKPYTPTMDSDLGYFELVIKRYPQGRMSHHFCGHGPGQVVLKYILDGCNSNQGRFCGFSSFFVVMNLMREGSYEAKSNYCTSEEQQKRGVLARLAGFQVIPNVCCRTWLGCDGYELLNVPRQSVQIGSILSTHMLTGAICGTLINWHLLVYEVVAKEVSIASHEPWRSKICDGRLAAGVRIASTLVSWRGRIHLCCFHYSGLGTSQILRREECHGPNYFGWVSLGLVD